MIIALLIIVCIIVVVVLSSSNNDKGTNNNLPFDNAFKNRMGQDPASYVASKLATGSDLGAIRYLFDIITAEVELKSKCKSPGFDFYYAKVLENKPVKPAETAQPKPAVVQRTPASAAPKHRWTMEEDVLCCRRFFEQYVIQQSSMDLLQFAEQLHQALPSISVGSLKMKTQNIKQLCIEHGIRNSLDAKPLVQYSQQNYRAFLVVKQEFGL